MVHICLFLQEEAELNISSCSPAQNLVIGVILLIGVWLRCTPPAPSNATIAAGGVIQRPRRHSPGDSDAPGGFGESMISLIKVPGLDIVEVSMVDRCHQLLRLRAMGREMA